MGSSADTAKTLLIPALVSLTIFLVSRFAIVPLWRRYRQRYSQYLPVGISAHTMGLRDRFHTAYTTFIMRRRNRDERFMEEGEELGHVDEGAWDRAARRADADHSDRRLSRDLEQGFRSDSDGEGDQRDRR